MCEAVLSVERGRMHVGLRTVGVPCVAPPYVGGGALYRCEQVGALTGAG